MTSGTKVLDNAMGLEAIANLKASHPEVLVKPAREDNYEVENQKVANAIVRSANLKAEAKRIKDELDREEKVIRDFADGLKTDAGSVRLAIGEAEAKATFKKSVIWVAENSWELVKKFLKPRRFKELVKQKVTYAPTKAFVDLVNDGDSAEGKKLRPHIKTKSDKTALEFTLK